MLESKKILGPVAAYIRVSTDEQAERDTPELQRQEIVRWGAYQGIELIGPYYDDISGKIPLAGRPGGAQLLQDAQKGLFTHVVVYKLDRLARRLKVLIDERDHLSDLGIGLVSIKESLSTDEYLGRLMFNILGTIAEWEVETLALRVDAGRRVKIKDGKWIGGWLPFGYQTDSEQRLILCPDEVPVVKEMWEQYAAGGTQWSVMESLNARGERYWRTAKVQNRGDAEPTIRTRAEWKPIYISRMFSNPLYKGSYSWGGIESEVHVPPIISQALWERVAQRIDKTRNRMISNDTVALASGILICASCGEKYYHWRRKSVTVRNGKRHEYTYETYCCGGRRFGRCHSKILRIEEVDTEIWRYAEQWIRNPPLDEWLRESRGEAQEAISGLDAEVATYLAQAQELSEGKQEVLRLARKKLISEQDLEKQLLEIGVEEHLIQLGIDRIQRDIANRQQNSEHKEALFKLITQLNAKADEGFTLQEKKQFVHQCLVGGLVTTIDRGKAKKKDAKIEYRWEFTLPTVVNMQEDVCTLDAASPRGALFNGTTRTTTQNVDVFKGMGRMRRNHVQVVSSRNQQPPLVGGTEVTRSRVFDSLRTS